MPKRFILGLTGGIGVGKSTCTNWFKEQGIRVFDCDAEVHALYKNSETVSKLESIYGALGENPRHTLASRALANPKMLTELRDFFSPYMLSNWESFLDLNPEGLLVLDHPLLLETGWELKCDHVAVVWADLHTREERVLARPNMTYEKLKTIMSFQVDDGYRQLKANTIIRNNTTLENLHVQLSALIKSFEQ